MGEPAGKRVKIGVVGGDIVGVSATLDSSLKQLR